MVPLPYDEDSGAAGAEDGGPAVLPEVAYDAFAKVGVGPGMSGADVAHSTVFREAADEECGEGREEWCQRGGAEGAEGEGGGTEEGQEAVGCVGAGEVADEVFLVGGEAVDGEVGVAADELVTAAAEEGDELPALHLAAEEADAARVERHADVADPDSIALNGHGKGFGGKG